MMDPKVQNALRDIATASGIPLETLEADAEVIGIFGDNEAIEDLLAFCNASRFVSLAALRRQIREFEKGDEK